MDLNKLDDPFDPNDIEWRVQQCGISNDRPWCMVLAYVTNRAIQQRLDAVCGKENWQNDYFPAPDGGIMCSISIKVGDNWITKKDGAENTQIEAVKGGISGAMKRAGVQWGIGRYLYNLTESFANCTLEKNNNWNKAITKDKKVIYWETPTLPDWALPKDYLLSFFISDAKKCETLESLKAVFLKYYERFKSVGIDKDLEVIKDKFKLRIEEKEKENDSQD